MNRMWSVDIYTMIIIQAEIVAFALNPH